MKWQLLVVLLALPLAAALTPSPVLQGNYTQIYGADPIPSAHNWTLSGCAYNAGFSAINCSTSYALQLSPDLGLSRYSEVVFVWEIGGINATNGKVYAYQNASTTAFPRALYELNSTFNGFIVKPEPGYSPNIVVNNARANVTMRWNTTGNSTLSLCTQTVCQNYTGETFNGTGNYLRVDVGSVTGNLTIYKMAVYAPTAQIVQTPTITIVANVSAQVTKNAWFPFTLNITATQGSIPNLSNKVYFDPMVTDNKSYLSPSTPVGNKTIQQWIDYMANATWRDTITVITPSGSMATPRWYTTEGNYGDAYLNTWEGRFTVLNSSNATFGGVTDEHSMTQQMFAVSTMQWRYEALHNTSVLLRNASADNNQCWVFYVTGVKQYNLSSELCKSGDSASDATLKIGNAMAIACAKQRAGIWVNGSVDYCADYETQMNNHFAGETRLLTNGVRMLCNGHDNAANCPTASQSFRPDYYVLQVIYDYAEYTQNVTWERYANDSMYIYNRSLGTNNVHTGKTGYFNNATLGSYICGELCAPPYVDNVDTWRAIIELSVLKKHHSADLGLWNWMFDFWDLTFGTQVYNATSAKPNQLYSNAANGTIYSTGNDYKTDGMWLPLYAAYNLTEAGQLVNYSLLNHLSANGTPYAAAYAGAYYYPYLARGIATASGLDDPQNIAAYAANKSLIATTNGATPFYTNGSNPAIETCLESLVAGQSCLITRWVNATGNIGSQYTFNGFVDDATLGIVYSNDITVTIVAPPPQITALTTLAWNYGVNLTVTFNQAVNLSVRGPATIDAATFSTAYEINMSNLLFNTSYPTNLTFCAQNCTTYALTINTTAILPNLTSASYTATDESIQLTLVFTEPVNITMIGPQNSTVATRLASHVVNFASLAANTTYAFNVTYCAQSGVCKKALGNVTTHTTATAQLDVCTSAFSSFAKSAGFVPLAIAGIVLTIVMGILFTVMARKESPEAIVTSGTNDMFSLVLGIGVVVIVVIMVAALGISMVGLGC